MYIERIVGVQKHVMGVVVDSVLAGPVSWQSITLPNYLGMFSGANDAVKSGDQWCDP